ncbi:GNAT family N-acetyltransferase (plasmid) [Devosia neptuniae]|uniref:GNAT family N-acetyltransferase n=1 Tax=Devosia neptuniae TaxID=191302 RepID=A0ABY6C6T0_9HYPH|nr:GNAT family N-acetyltransferase [Devosia neptuniae]UXN67847.1 GNAT family N-acetyltransferase [Devosia neptuniae]
MEYHADRFTDHSLMYWDDDRLVAVLPASQTNELLVSHGGLTYGGLVLAPRTRALDVLQALGALRDYARATGIEKIVYKAVPYIFHALPSQDDLYALTRLNARLVRRDISSVIHLDAPRKPSKGRKSLISRAKKAQLVMSESDDWNSFHRLLADVLARHGAAPVHSVDELRYLKSRFADRISLRCVEQDGKLLAATLIFFFDTVAHTQYIATSEDGKFLGALDFLLDEVIEECAGAGKKYFSFGISSENGGRELNEGLIAQKEGFGGRGVTLDWYEIDVND